MRLILSKPVIYTGWLPWFAWYPVMVEFASGEEGFIWLETVERRDAQWYGGLMWRYRELMGKAP